MATLSIRNVPELLHERLRQRAKAQHRSLSAEVIFLLETTLRHDYENQAVLLDRIRQRRTFDPAEAGAPDTITLLREDRDR